MSLSISTWVTAARPKTLTAAIIPVLVGTALVHSAAEFKPYISLLALLAAALIQIGTNLFNDAIDFERGADTSSRVGPARITAQGIVAPKSVKRVATAIFILALVIGSILVAHAGIAILVIGIASLVFGYCYTGGPYPLAYNGLGELFVVIFFGLVAVTGIEILQLQPISSAGLIAGLQVGLLATVLIVINNARDIDQDLKAGKLTLAARYGASFAKAELAICSLVPYLLACYWVFERSWIAAAAPFLALPLSVRALQVVIMSPPGPAYNQALHLAAAAHALFGVGLAIGLALI